MKLFFAAALLAFPLLNACEHPLERVADEHRQQRVDAAYANKPINYGSGDGLGMYTAHSAQGSGLSLTSHTPSP